MIAAEAFANLVVGIALAALLTISHLGSQHPTCMCQGECKPNPCEFAWNPKTGEIDRTKLFGNFN